MLIVGLVKSYSKGLVGLLESVKHPSVHHLPQLAHLRISFLPLHEHLVNLVDNARVLLFHLGILDVAVTYKMVALLAGTLRSRPVKALLPCIHTLADMHSPVIDKRSLDDFVSRSLEQVGNAGAEQVVAHVSEVKRLVGIWRAKFDHDPASRGRELAESAVRVHRIEGLAPVNVGQREVQEALYSIEGADFGTIFHQPATNGIACIDR